MAITAAMVKELRELSGAGMMDCKKALNETNGDMEAAMEFLRKNGQAKAEKKAGRIAAEGLCRIAVKNDTTAAGGEVNSAPCVRQTSLPRTRTSRNSLQRLHSRQ